ncbi:MAG: ATP-binding protein [Gammaproteobacteria bacterium]|nr:ATP-binding protein [Gammaproteobacteria bacterium]MDH3856553.1 ATP-binding protein [Gammaproteobacteria bacterium]
MKPARVYYPWPSTLAALAVITWQFLLANAALFTEHPLPESMRQQDRLLIAGAVLVLLMTFDAWRFLKASARCKEQLRQHQDQISELFDSKRELGTRARTYSDHADKLKMFISERLLEYIEYDEKYLHFKNIASEVRHNGVISYDKAQTALKHAQLTCEVGEQQQYREAADGLLYLWDLLDLSTTDNITLHVANQIYDCEEHYFQALLNDDATEPTPFQPTFMMSHALRRALLPITDNPDQLGLNNGWPKRGSYRDEKFKILLQADSEMLGNENHMVLLIENLLNNALFYAQQKAYKNRYSSVSIRLAQRGGEVVLEVYNRGPRINDDEKDKIYQLGFSSRRIREHHGKGLGLYFVNEITKGFEGSIVFNNIDNREDSISLSIKLVNGEIHKEQLEIVEVDGRPMCRLTGSEDKHARRNEWSYAAPIASIEISPGAVKKPQVISGLKSGEDSSYLDATDSLLPRWVLDVKNRKRSAKLVFMPLDVRGVEFVARVPTAKSRLDNQD